MIEGLRAHRLLEGCRGAAPVDQRGQADGNPPGLLLFVMELEDRIESIDINPLLCSAGGCVVADAHIILKRISGTVSR